jgi:hypothetical protein
MPRTVAAGDAAKPVSLMSFSIGQADALITAQPGDQRRRGEGDSSGLSNSLDDVGIVVGHPAARQQHSAKG